MKALANVIWYSTTFVQKSQKSLLINLLTRSSLHIWKLYPVNNPKLTEIFTPIHSRLEYNLMDNTYFVYISKVWWNTLFTFQSNLFTYQRYDEILCLHFKAICLHIKSMMKYFVYITNQFVYIWNEWWNTSQFFLWKMRANVWSIFALCRTAACLAVKN